MPSHDWRPFLARWSAELLSSQLADVFPPEVRSSGWVGRPGAGSEALQAAEARLGKSLPPSYRAFLQTCDGWPMVLPLLGRLWSAERIGWLADTRPSLVEAWLMGESLAGGGPPVSDARYLVYGEEQDPALIRIDYLRSALEISSLDVGDDAIYLLNPEITTADGEWEAWYLASWLPGAIRYPTFWDMMHGEYRGFREALADIQAPDDEYLSYVRSRLFPGDAVEATEVLEKLIAGLKQKLERLLAKGEPGGRATLPGYRREMKKTYEDVLASVLEIKAQESDSERVRQRLGDLAEELEVRTGRDVQTALKAMDLTQILRAELQFRLSGTRDEFDLRFSGSGRAAATRTAAEVIRTVLGET